MGYVLKAVLSSAQHPEYGQITVPFPIPDEKYDRMIELLEPLEIGDALRQDCRVDELDSFYTRICCGGLWRLKTQPCQTSHQCGGWAGTGPGGILSARMKISWRFRALSQMRICPVPAV